jgi:hypothetical protein
MTKQIMPDTLLVSNVTTFPVAHVMAKIDAEIGASPAIMAAQRARQDVTLYVREDLWSATRKGTIAGDPAAAAVEHNHNVQVQQLAAERDQARQELAAEKAAHAATTEQLHAQAAAAQAATAKLQAIKLQAGVEEPVVPPGSEPAPAAP